jgi:hypothetical protein
MHSVHQTIIIIIIIISGSTLVRTLVASHWKFRNPVKTHGRTPLDERSAHRKGFYPHRTTQQTNIHALSGIRNRDPSNQEAADLRLRPRGHQDRTSDYTMSNYRILINNEWETIWKEGAVAKFKVLSWNMDSSVSIGSGYGLDDRAIEVRSPAEAKEFVFYPMCPTGSGAHPASCTMGTGVLSSGLKCGQGVTLTTHPSKAEVEN